MTESRCLDCINKLTRSVLIAFVVSLPHLAVRSTSAREQASAPPAQYALLIGCTKYPYCPQAPELWGPANDIPVYAELLQHKFRIPLENIKILLGWSGDPTSRPTLANITAAFDELIERAAPGDQIAIMMNGHGTQVPVLRSSIESIAPRDRELDGLDEVFLPADVEPGLARAIRDDQIADWLARLRGKGAHVWIVFDCCHSGTMTRDAVGRERTRGLNPWDLGVSRESLRQAAQLARRAREAGTGSAQEAMEGILEPALAPDSDRSADAGSVTAFFAALPHELTPELPQPRDAPRNREHYFGLFSYALAQTLANSDASMTYRELGRRTAARLRAERGSRGPNPQFTGSLDRRVLGNATARPSPILLRHINGTPTLSRGTAAGITTGTVLSVSARAAEPHPGTRPLGHVQVTRTGPLHAEVESVLFEGDTQQLDLQCVPEFAVCRVERWEVGDLRLSIGIEFPRTKQSDAVEHRLRTALSERQPLSKQVRVASHGASPSWILKLVDPPTALHRHSIRSDRDLLLLLANSWKAAVWTEAMQSEVEMVADLRPVVASYPLEDMAATVEQLDIDLGKIFRWQTLWRLAGAGETDDQRPMPLQFDVYSVDKLHGKGDSRTRRPAPHVLRSGDLIELELANPSREDWSVSLLYLDANFGVEIWVAEVIPAGRSLEPIFVRIDDESLGAEGFLVLAAPIRSMTTVPEFEFLEQAGLGLATRDAGRPPQRPATPLQRMLCALRESQAVWQRGQYVHDPANPRVLAWTWTSLAAGSN